MDNLSKRIYKNFILGLILNGVFFVPSLWADMPTEQIEPPHVFARAKLIQDEIELLRLEMGKPKPSLLDITISKAKPREVYFQALTLYQKTDRLCFDHTGNTGPIPPKLKQDNISPRDVFEVLTRARTRVRCILNKWNITESANEPSPNPSHTPSNVYKKILEINRQLNNLLDIPYSPSTVYRRFQETNEIIKFLILLENPNSKLPKPISFERKKRPEDVFFQTEKCLKILQRMSFVMGIKFLDYKVKRSNAIISPGDVYDLISLVLAGIQHIGKRIDHEYFEASPKLVSFPDRKFPSHVYQKAVYLEKLLLQWQAAVAESLTYDK
jgi:hypothetical protein